MYFSPMLVPLVGSSIAQTTTANDTGSTSLYTFTDLDIGLATTSREVFIVGGSRSASARTGPTVTIGGISATVNSFGANSRVFVARAAVPTGTTADVSCTFSGAMDGCRFAVYRVLRSTKGSAVSTSDTDSGTIDAIGTPVSLTASVPKDGFAFTSFMNLQGNTSPSISDDFTRDYFGNFGINAAVSVGVLTSQFPTAAGNKTATFSWSGMASDAYQGALWTFTA